jgi:signal transduction histidine kinase
MSERGEALVQVSDTGIGVAPEHLGRIFDRFYRVDKARSRAVGGAGLGLSIAREIMEAHGGRLEIVSEPGRGTTVTMRMRLAHSV